MTQAIEDAIGAGIESNDTITAVDGRSETHFNRLLELTDYLDKADADMYDELARLENN